MLSLINVLQHKESRSSESSSESREDTLVTGAELQAEASGD